MKNNNLLIKCQMGSESNKFRPEICLNVIQEFMKTDNLSIIKTPESPVPAESLLQTGRF